MSVLAETDGDPAALAAPLRGIVRALDVNQPVYDVRVFSTLYRQRAINVPLRIMQMVGTMGLIGLMLALIGLYGLIAYSVARRTREIGVRMALGAARWDVLRMVLGQGVVLSLAGIIVGGCVSLVVARLLVATLVGLASPNAATYVIVPLTLIGLTLAASYVPARRASRVDPVRALRYE
ncbi:MAG: FtsX-like permease family protein [Acidobacteria bacterium]|nr:FtsX-like permease family protein [Acidobacteriota bacterium]